MSKLLVRVPCLAITPLYLTPTRVSSEPDAFSSTWRAFWKPSVRAFFSRGNPLLLFQFCHEFPKRAQQEASHE